MIPRFLAIFFLSFFFFSPLRKERKRKSLLISKETKQHMQNLGLYIQIFFLIFRSSNKSFVLRKKNLIYSYSFRIY